MNARAWAFAAVALATLTTAAGAQQRVDERMRTSASGPVEIVNVAGSVRVVGWSRNEVAVTGTAGRGTERVEIAEEGGRTVVRVVLPRRGRNVDGSELEVRVPERRDLLVRTTSADATVGGVEGAVEVRSVSGEVRVDGRPRSVAARSRSGEVTLQVTSERAAVETTSGEIRVRGALRRALEARSVSGDVTLSATTPEARVETVSGEIRLEGVTGRTDAKTVSGDMVVRGRGLQGEFRSVSGDIRLDGDLDPAGTTTVNSHSGDVVLAMGGTRAADVSVATFSGEVDNGLANAQVTRSGDREWRLRTGRGGARVSVRTFSGDVRLTDR